MSTKLQGSVKRQAPGCVNALGKARQSRQARAGTDLMKSRAPLQPSPALLPPDSLASVPAEECLADPVAAAAGAVEVRVGGRGDPVQEAGVAVMASVVARMAAAVPVPLVQYPCLKERTLCENLSNAS